MDPNVPTTQLSRLLSLLREDPLASTSDGSRFIGLRIGKSVMNHNFDCRFDPYPVFCTACKGALVDPVTDYCGHTYCRLCLEDMEFCLKCSQTKRYLPTLGQLDRLKVNIVLSRMMEKFSKVDALLSLKLQAYRLYKSALYEEAADLISRRITKSPPDVYLMNLRCKCFLKLGRPEQAVADADCVFAFTHKNTQCYLLKAQAMRMLDCNVTCTKTPYFRCYTVTSTRRNSRSRAMKEFVQVVHNIAQQSQTTPTSNTSSTPREAPEASTSSTTSTAAATATRGRNSPVAGTSGAIGGNAPTLRFLAAGGRESPITTSSIVAYGRDSPIDFTSAFVDGDPSVPGTSAYGRDSPVAGASSAPSATNPEPARDDGPLQPQNPRTSASVTIYTSSGRTTSCHCNRPGAHSRQDHRDGGDDDDDDEEPTASSAGQAEGGGGSAAEEARVAHTSRKDVLPKCRLLRKFRKARRRNRPLVMNGGRAESKRALTLLTIPLNHPEPEPEDEGAEPPNRPPIALDEPIFFIAKIVGMADAEELECPLCFKAFLDPVTTPCGHTFCLDCMRRSLDHAPACPLCKESLHQYLAARLFNPTEPLQWLLETGFESEMKARRASKMSEMTSMESILKGEDVPIFVCTVGYPSVNCPLHLFEPRYKLMLRRSIESGVKMFGMCKAPANTPENPVASTVNEHEFSPYGVMLRLVSVHYSPDGRSVLHAVGCRRFQVVDRRLRDGYYEARVEYLVDSPVPPEEVEDMKAQMRTVHQKCAIWLSTLNEERASRILHNYGPLPGLEDYGISNIVRPHNVTSARPDFPMEDPAFLSPDEESQALETVGEPQAEALQDLSSEIPFPEMEVPQEGTPSTIRAAAEVVEEEEEEEEEEEGVVVVGESPAEGTFGDDGPNWMWFMVSVLPVPDDVKLAMLSCTSLCYRLKYLDSIIEVALKNGSWR